MNLPKEDYYEVGTINDLVVSQSALKTIDPALNGSPRKFRAFIEDRVEQPSQAMLRGSMFHLWHENREAFVIADFVKPSEKLGLVADLILEKYNTLDEQSQEELILMLDQHVLQACRTLEWNKTWGDAAIIKNAQAVNVYIQNITNPENKGKIVLTTVLKEQIEKCIVSLQANEYANSLLFWRSEFSEIEYYKELEIYWNVEVAGTILPFKCKLDDLLIDHSAKIIKLNDLKTTSGSAYNFEGTFKAFRLDLQFYTYWLAILAKFPEYKDYKFEFRHIVVETSGLFQTVVHKWNPTIIMDTKPYFENLFSRVVNARANGYTMSMEEIAGKGEIKHSKIDW